MIAIMYRILSCFFGLIVATTSVYADSPLVLGVHPFKPATKLLESFTPLTNYLSQNIHRPVTIKISKTYQEHMDSIGKDEIDIAYLGPAPFVKMQMQYGSKRLLARQTVKNLPTFQGKIFVRTDSPIQTLKDLAGKSFAFGDPNSTMSYLLPHYMLLQAGIKNSDLGKIGDLRNHVNIILAVLAGEYDAGAVKEDIFYEYESRGVRAIATSPAISDHVFVASNKLDETTIKILKAALLDLNKDPHGPDILQGITEGVTALIDVNNSDYDNLREILLFVEQQGTAPK